MCLCDNSTGLFSGKPIIGIIGGIGSGKSHVANLFGELDCIVIDSDKQARAAFDDPEVRNILRSWWGEQIVPIEKAPVDRRAIAKIVFEKEAERLRLESVIHPWVKGARDREMAHAVQSGRNFLAFVWDTPLLCETGLHEECDAVVFVEAELATRLERVAKRGWSREELARREILQWPLDKKRAIADYVIRNTTDAEDVRVQIREVLSRILAKIG